MLSRFHLIPERYGQTDGQTDRRTYRIAISISRVNVLTRDKNSAGAENLRDPRYYLQYYCVQTAKQQLHCQFTTRCLL